MDKSPDAFRTISEVADHLDTPAHVLRFWESRFPQIRPVKRAGGRRYYRPSDVALLIGIKRLLHDEGMTIRGVQKILREQGVRHVSGATAEAATVEGAEGQYKPADLGPEDAGPEDAVIVPLRTDAVTPRRDSDSAAGLVLAMAHDTGKAKAPVDDTPAQGALLLTPVPDPEGKPDPAEENGDAAEVTAGSEASLIHDDASPDNSGLDDPDLDGPNLDRAGVAKTGSDFVPSHDAGLPGAPAVSMPEDPGSAELLPPPAQSLPGGEGDLEDDDFDDGPVTTLASRIRALPGDAVPAPHVRAELIAIADRLRALRDAAATAAGPGRM